MAGGLCALDNHTMHGLRLRVGNWHIMCRTRKVLDQNIWGWTGPCPSFLSPFLTSRSSSLLLPYLSPPLAEYLAKLQARAWLSCALVRLANTLLKDGESAQHNCKKILACNFAKYSAISIFFIHRLSNKPFLIWLSTTLSYLNYAATLSCNLSLMPCFADINVSQGSVATYARCGGIFEIYLTANFLWKYFLKRVKNWQNYGRESAAPFFGPSCTSIQLRRACRTARSDKNTNSCHRTFNKTVTGDRFHHTCQILQTNKKTRKINLFNATPKAFKDDRQKLPSVINIRKENRLYSLNSNTQR